MLFKDGEFCYFHSREVKAMRSFGWKTRKDFVRDQGKRLRKLNVPLPKSPKNEEDISPLPTFVVSICDKQE